MLNNFKAEDEAGRLHALERYGLRGDVRDPGFDAITSIVREVLGVPICAVSLINEDRQTFASRAGLDLTHTARRVAFCDHTIRGSAPMVVEDATLDPRFAGNPLVTEAPGIRSYAGAPLTTPDGYNLGALCAIDNKPRQFPEADLALLSRFAGLVVEQIELRTLAHRDFLTGTLTRRAFEDAAKSALAGLARRPRALTMLVLDVDHFKAINDGFGHPAGDRVLKAVAETCRATLRAEDLLGRIGGEEFAVILNGLDETEALHCAERLRHAIGETAVPGAPAVTVSIGLVPAWPGATLERLLAAADAALYAAKSGGRNRCVAGGAQFSVAA